MASETSGSETRTDSTVAPRYRQFLVGYLALTVVSTATLLVLARHSSNLMAAIEVVGGGVVLVVASAATIPVLYKDAVGLTDSRWDPSWKRYVAFILGTPTVVYLAVAYVTMANVAVVIASIAFVVATFEAIAVYLYRRHTYIGKLG